MQTYPTLAAIDLGSNSFHLQVGRVEGEQLFYLDAIKESVRLAGGLNANKRLDGASQRRALNCLARFGERLQGMPAGAVRAVGTSALRVAKNAPEFLEKARAALGFEIEIVAGREEARLIYLGVSHSLPLNTEPRLVVDIGGGSSECIIGTGYEAQDRESLRMGCVVFSNRFFASGVIDKASMKAAEIAARIETRLVAGPVFGRGAWVEAVGSSGSARALGDICRQNGHSDGAITLEGLRWLREQLIKLGHIDQLDLLGLKPDRRPVIVGGLAIMLAIFEELGVETMTVAQGAMREGILWDLLGRVHDRDMRDITVSQFQRRYQVDMAQAQRVETQALALFQALTPSPEAERRLAWAMRLHEVGISIAHSGFHKHGAYILENADMPGFSRRDQTFMALLVRASRGGLDKLGLAPNAAEWPLILCLRLALLFNMSRSDAVLPAISLNCEAGVCRLSLPADWLKDNPLTRAVLDDEVRDWAKAAAGLRLELA
ncbi:MAG: Ppx/GppA phosphatase family protein [Gallionellaceae bacterium]|nr:Ppx/GppA phosphatase family protein [Gallionellaceae bacterium]